MSLLPNFSSGGEELVKRAINAFHNLCVPVSNGGFERPEAQTLEPIKVKYKFYSHCDNNQFIAKLAFLGEREYVKESSMHYINRASLLVMEN